MTTNASEWKAMIEGRDIAKGDVVLDFRGEKRVFGGITRGLSEGRSGKIMLGGRELYHHVVPGLTLHQIAPKASV